MSNMRLTTVDNPYNPFTQWDDWYLYDLQMGYHTCERLASISLTSDALSEEENNAIAEEAANKVIKLGAFNKNGELIEYKKVYSDES